MSDPASSAASPITQPIRAPREYPFPSDPAAMTGWLRAEEQLCAARSYWLATTRPDGRPHVTPLWGVWVDGCWWFDGLPSARWARNLAHNPAASLHLESGEDVVIVDGVVDDLTADAETAARIVDAWNTKYGELAPEPTTRGIFRLRPRSARAWTTERLTDGARWEFSAVSS